MKKQLTRLACSVFLVFLQVHEAKSVNYTSFGSGSWSNQYNWTPIGIPGAGDNVTITFGDDIALTANVQCASITIENSLSTTSLSLGSYTLTVSGNVTIEGTSLSGSVSRIATQTGTLTIAGNLVFTGTVASTAVLDMSGGAGTVNLAGAFTVSSQGTFICGTTGTFNYTKSTAQAIIGATYNNLVLSGGGIKSLGGNATVNSKLSLQDAATFSLNSRTLTYGASAVLEYKSSSAQSTGPELAASNLPSGLIVNNASGVTLSTDGLTVSTLTLTSGPFRLNGKTFAVGGSAATALSRSSGYLVSEDNSVNGSGKAVNGSRLQWNIGSGTGSYVFPFGTSGGTYIPFTFAVTAGTVGNVTVATYPTSPSNTPLPVQAAHVYDYTNTNVDNSGNTVDRFWEITKTGVSGTATLTFTYADAEIPASGENGSDNQGMRAQSWNGNSWGTRLPSQVFSAAANTVTVPSVTTLASAWALALNFSPLPVELLYFRAEEQEDKVQLSWATAVELNNASFRIERSADGRAFTEIASLEGAMNSTSVRTYSYTDTSAPAGKLYYRLRQNDASGEYSYSSIEAVEVTPDTDLHVWTESGQLRVRALKGGGEAFQVRIFDMSGREMLFKSGTLASEEVVTIACEGFPEGVYIVSVHYKADILRRKIRLGAG